MDTKNIIVLVWDSPSNFNLDITQRSYGNGNIFKDVIQFQSLENLKLILENIDESDNLVFACHVSMNDFILYEDFKNLQIENTLKIPVVYYLSSDGQAAMKGYTTKYGGVEKILYYHEFIRFIRSEEIKPIPKSFLKTRERPKNQTQETKINDIIPKCDYVIITALEKDEMEKVLPMINEVGIVEDSKHLIAYGHLKGNASKKIAYATQTATGMIDAAILATKMIQLFKPKFVIMTGVLGGKPGTAIGDVVVSTKVFTIDKGKMTEGEFQREIESSSTESAYVTKFRRVEKDIKRFIEDKDKIFNKQVNIHFEPIACVRSVVNKEGYFVENVSIVDRKAIALEMESYGITRACEITNNGSAIPLIIKSVMDNTQDKNTDDPKPFAGWTSAMFLRYILEKDLI